VHYGKPGRPYTLESQATKRPESCGQMSFKGALLESFGVGKSCHLSILIFAPVGRTRGANSPRGSRSGAFSDPGFG